MNIYIYTALLLNMYMYETLSIVIFRSGMAEGAYYVKVKVDGILVADADMCKPNGPQSSNCRFEVSLMFVSVFFICLISVEK